MSADLFKVLLVDHKSEDEWDKYVKNHKAHSPYNLWGWSEAVENGYGLRNMQTRIEELDGSISIDSSEQQGCSITISVPIEGE